MGHGGLFGHTIATITLSLMLSIKLARGRFVSVAHTPTVTPSVQGEDSCSSPPHRGLNAINLCTYTHTIGSLEVRRIYTSVVTEATLQMKHFIGNIKYRKSLKS